MTDTPPQAIKLTRRTPAEQLRYLAVKLNEGDTSTLTIAFALEVLASELDSPAPALEAMAAAEAAWIEAYGTVEGCGGLAHAAWEAAWQAGGAYERKQFAYEPPAVVIKVEGGAITEAEWNKLGDTMRNLWREWRVGLLRQEGGDGHRARVGQVQIGRWQQALARAGQETPDDK